jgi:hypothetical protein
MKKRAHKIGHSIRPKKQHVCAGEKLVASDWSRLLNIRPRSFRRHRLLEMCDVRSGKGGSAVAEYCFHALPQDYRERLLALKEGAGIRSFSELLSTTEKAVEELPVVRRLDRLMREVELATGKQINSLLIECYSNASRSPLIRIDLPLPQVSRKKSKAPHHRNARAGNTEGGSHGG